MTNTRINIVGDMDPSEPYDDGSSPLFRIEWTGFSWQTTQVTGITSYKVDLALVAGISAVFNCHDGLLRRDDLLARYLSIWFGVTKVERWHSGDYWYMTCDPSDWREEVGAPAGSISLTEWQAYCQGDVYGVVLEQLVEWTAPDGRTMPLWEQVDSCWGFYGIDAAKEYALETYGADATLVEGA